MTVQDLIANLALCDPLAEVRAAIIGASTIELSADGEGLLGYLDA